MEMEPMFSKGCWSLIHGENAATNLHSCTVSGQTQTVWIPDPWVFFFQKLYAWIHFSKTASACCCVQIALGDSVMQF
uniref:Uncharacterized protein n=1 Tax=Triticum urartu TaxID=4572 RepID=A0A8R7P7V6_TRIUA